MYSVVVAYLISIIAACVYVVAVHLGQKLSLDRNDPVVIRGRMLRVSIACVILIIGTPLLLTYVFQVYPDTATSLRQLKLFNFQKLGMDLQSVLLICVLYVGPIWDYLYSINYDMKKWLKEMNEEITLIWGIRDLIFAPVTEELVYRSIILLIFNPLLASGSMSRTAYIITTPLVFGVSHIHHGYTLYTFKKIQLPMVLFNGFVQFTYTTLFGILSNYLLLKNDSIYGCIIVHSICNCMGFPELVPEMSESVYYPMLVVGMIGFYFLL